MNIRQNQQDLHNYISDLGAWVGEVKDKDTALREGRVDDGSDDRPAPRGRASLPSEGDDATVTVKKKVKKKKDQQKPDGPGGKSHSKAGHTYDYFRDKWDKFHLVLERRDWLNEKTRCAGDRG